MIGTATQREAKKYGVAGAIAEEVLGSIRTVISFNGQRQESKRYETALANGKRDGIAKSLYTGVGMAITFFVMFSSYGLAFWYGSTLIVDGVIERGTVFTVLFAVMMGSFALGNAGPQIAVLAGAKGAAASIFEIIDNRPTIDPYRTDGAQPEAAKGEIQLTNVHFAYPARSEVAVLDNVTFTVRPGEKVALVGSSGCGKSTIVSLLLRYYDVQSGSITIDGTRISDLNVRWLRRTIGVVSQEPVLFEATIAENIRLGRRNISTTQMETAARAANAHTFIQTLPHGYETRVGERGVQLSGGQKQRIAIARALIRDPKILLLDEATSALDGESEAIVQQALDAAQQGRTTIIIAHRLSTVRNADKIIAMDGGRVVETGTHADLMQAKGLYHKLVTSQVFVDTAKVAEDGQLAQGG